MENAMYDRLQKINSQIDEFIQEKLGNRYKDILDYNLNTPNRAEPVTLLVLYDFPKFPERIIFSLGSNDADNLIENVSVAGLRDNTVYFTDGVKNTFQMKPYITPSANELKKLFD